MQIQTGRQTITAADPLSDDLRQALEAITRNSRVLRRDRYIPINETMLNPGASGPP
jgi:hypothetical protein